VHSDKDGRPFDDDGPIVRTPSRAAKMSGLFDVVSDSAPAIEYELQNAGNFQDIEQIARDARARSSNSLQAPSAITSESDSHAPSAVERSKVWLDCDPGKN